MFLVFLKKQNYFFIEKLMNQMLHKKFIEKRDIY